uniref:DDE Tnp4 domain-containing protein n=1 Tax=Cyprinus carpio TaxID=7962 RepID=A0A8C2HKI6_CYPCA
MEPIEGMVFLILGMWMFLTSRRRNVFKMRLMAAKQITAKKTKRVWELLQRSEDDDITRFARRRTRMYHILQSRRHRPSVWTFNRASEWWGVIVPGFTNTQWLENFRMSEETFIYLCNKLRPAMERRDTNFRVCVPLKKRVAIALWKLATGSEYRSVGHLFGASISTVCRCVQEFCAAAETLLIPEQIRFPDQERFKEMAAYIENRWGLPQCIGAIDGSHIPIIAPQDYHCDYFNRKGWHSIILQGVVDGKGLFWNVFTGLPGSLHDARVLRLSTLWEVASRGNHIPASTKNIAGVNVGYYILGDSAYPLQNWLLKPFIDTGRLTAEQRFYNMKISRARVVVENAFGRLKGRWRCLMKRNDCAVHLVKSMVLTCCALHNLCESHGEAYESAWDPPSAAEPVLGLAQPVEEEGRDVREALMRY